MERLLVPDGQVWVFQKLLIYWNFHTQPSLGFTENEKEKISSERQLCGRKCLFDVRGQRRMGRLVRDDRKATRYNQGMQNSISEHTTRRTLKQMGYSSRRPHRGPLLSAKNRKRRLKFTQVHQNWTIEDWKNIAWSDESWFLLRRSDGRVRIWRKEHESKDPFFLVSTVQAAGGGVMVWGIFSWHTLGPLVPIEHCLNATAYLSIVADHVHPFMTTVYSHLLMVTSSSIMHVTKLKSSQTGFLNMTMSSLYSNGLHSHQISIQYSTFGMWWNGRFTSWMRSWQICSNCVMLSCQYDQNLRGMFPTPCWIYATKNQSSSEGKRGSTRY